MAVNAVRTVIIYVVLMVSLRLMGKRQLGDLQPIELVVTLLISDLAAVPMQEPGTPLLAGLIPIFVLVALELLLSGLMLKWPAFSRAVSGSPIVVVRHGQPLPDAMRKLRLTLDDLSDSLRKQGYFDLRDIDTAIVETGGSVSVYPRPEKRPLQCGDAGRHPHEPLPLPIVADGQPCDWAMRLCGWDQERLERTLQRESLSMEDVFMMIADEDGGYTVTRKGEAT